ncbi:MAG: hypothetical protein AAF961_04000 [Planctomycetota bacterium]
MACSFTGCSGRHAKAQAIATGHFDKPPAAESNEGKKRALIICGHPGDEEYAELFSEWTDRIRASLLGRFGFAREEVWVWFGVEQQDQSLVESRGPATREAIREGVRQLRDVLAEEDELWVIVIAHAHAEPRQTQLNLPGPDVTAMQFGEWFAGATCRRSIFFITTPLSGYFVKPLSAPGRVVIAATEADFEINATLFPAALAKNLESFPEGEKEDFDKDGAHSLLDFYVSVAEDVAAQYEQDELIATEHAQLDDNGDGHGTELQYDDLDPRDRRPIGDAVAKKADRDGDLARTIPMIPSAPKTSSLDRADASE